VKVVEEAMQERRVLSEHKWDNSLGEAGQRLARQRQC
jgi:hypothetical protein